MRDLEQHLHTVSDTKLFELLRQPPEEHVLPTHVWVCRMLEVEKPCPVAMDPYPQVELRFGWRMWDPKACEFLDTTVCEKLANEYHRIVDAHKGRIRVIHLEIKRRGLKAP